MKTQMALKSLYQEKVDLEELVLHQKKLKSISTIPPQLGALMKQIDVAKQFEVRHKSKINSSRFNEFKVNLERQRENKSLMDKLKCHQLPKKFINSHSHKSLISQGKKKEEHRITLENFNMARRMINLPSVIKVKKFDSDFAQHQYLSIIHQKYHVLKPKSTQSLINPELQILQQICLGTKDKFQRTKSYSNFSFLYSRIQKATTLCILDIKETSLFSSKFNNSEFKYFWEINLNDKRIAETDTKEYEEAQQEIIDFTWNQQQVEVSLHKAKNNNLFYIGQIDIGMKDLNDSLKRQYGNKIISETPLIQKTIHKVIEGQLAPAGIVSFRMITVHAIKYEENKKQDMPAIQTQELKENDPQGLKYIITIDNETQQVNKDSPYATAQDICD